MALVVAYYLSRYDRKAYSDLGYSTMNKAHQEIGRILMVNPNSVKNMRDEFDPIHDNPRAGWYQRPLRPSRAKVVETFQNLSEKDLRDVVNEYLQSSTESRPVELDDVIAPIAKRENAGSGNPIFVVRGPTGRKAEEIFVEHHKNTGEPVIGELQDTRDDGCGYDFQIVSAKGSVQIEVKGLDGASGGITFTSKEWDVAQRNGDSYYLVLVRNVGGDPMVEIIQNPAVKLSPKISIHTVVQVSWNVSNRDLANI